MLHTVDVGWIVDSIPSPIYRVHALCIQEFGTNTDHHMSPPVRNVGPHLRQHQSLKQSISDGLKMEEPNARNDPAARKLEVLHWKPVISRNIKYLHLLSAHTNALWKIRSDITDWPFFWCKRCGKSLKICWSRIEAWDLPQSLELPWVKPSSRQGRIPRQLCNQRNPEGTRLALFHPFPLPLLRTSLFNLQCRMKHKLRSGSDLWRRPRGHIVFCPPIMIESIIDFLPDPALSSFLNLQRWSQCLHQETFQRRKAKLSRCHMAPDADRLTKRWRADGGAAITPKWEYVWSALLSSHHMRKMLVLQVVSWLLVLHQCPWRQSAACVIRYLTIWLTRRSLIGQTPRSESWKRELFLFLDDLKGLDVWRPRVPTRQCPFLMSIFTTRVLWLRHVN